ncbi:MAG TPA: sialidase family protein [Acidimicrobiales bacterium]|nr:sialidase family protein [Acidimicrobiales bacterium]
MATALGAGLFLIPADAGTATDTQANEPQVSGDPTSDVTAVFPTNKQNEPSIAVNPLDPSRLIAGSNDEQRQPPCGPGPVRGNVPQSDCSFFPNVGTSGISTSSDGGVTWTNRGLLDDQASWAGLPAGKRLVSDGDPFIVYGPRPDASGAFAWGNGARAYYATLASYFDNAGPYPSSKVPEFLAVSYSDDNGVTWSVPVLATTKNNPNDFNDKESIWVDDLDTSPFFGRIYVSYTEFRSWVCCPSEPVMVTVSKDGGSTFSAPKQVSPAGNNSTGNGRQGSMARSGPDGTVYVAWEQGFQQVVAVSSDGGSRWTRPLVIGPVVDIPDPLPGSNFRTDSFLSIAADPRPGSTTVWAAWVNQTPAGARVVVTRSTSRAAGWSAPIEVSTAGEGDAFFQGLDVASSGRVDVAYQAQVAADRATFGTGNAAIDSWYVSKSDGGWSAPVKVSSASMDPAASSQNNLQRQFMGDYNTLVSTADHAWFIWTDTRNGVGCPAVDGYQHYLVDNGLVVRGDMGDRLASRDGKNPYASDPSVKPSPPTSCSPQFGNSDAFVAVITP